MASGCSIGTRVVIQREQPADQIADRRVRRHHRGDPHRLTAIGGLAALSLDALSSVAYGPEAIVLILVAAGAAAVRWTLPIAMAITVLLLVLVVSYRQVIAVHPNGGGGYAVAKNVCELSLGDPAAEADTTAGLGGLPSQVLSRDGGRVGAQFDRHDRAP
jgi:hypothetical protein